MARSAMSDGGGLSIFTIDGAAHGFPSSYFEHRAANLAEWRCAPARLSVPDIKYRYAGARCSFVVTAYFVFRSFSFRIFVDFILSGDISVIEVPPPSPWPRGWEPFDKKWVSRDSVSSFCLFRLTFIRVPFFSCVSSRVEFSVFVMYKRRGNSDISA